MSNDFEPRKPRESIWSSGWAIGLYIVVTIALAVLAAPIIIAITFGGHH